MRNIKTVTIIAVILIVILFCWNNLFITEEERSISSFNSVYVTGPINVYIGQGEKESVRVRSDSNIIDSITVEVVKEELRIYTKGPIRRERVLDVYINFSTIDSLHATGASTITGRGVIKQSNLKIKASGASETKLQIESDTVFLDMMGNANVQLAGKTGQFDFSISHVGDLMAYNLVSQHCIANINTGNQSPGIARINAEQTLDVKIIGPRHLKYKGKARITNKLIKGDGKLLKY